MTESSLAVAIVDKRKRKIVNGIILSGWLLIIATMIMVIGTALYLMLQPNYTKLPEELAQWCSISLGFLFATFANILTKYIDPGADT